MWFPSHSFFLLGLRRCVFIHLTFAPSGGSDLVLREPTNSISIVSIHRPWTYLLEVWLNGWSNWNSAGLTLQLRLLDLLRVLSDLFKLWIAWSCSVQVWSASHEIGSGIYQLAMTLIWTAMVKICCNCGGLMETDLWQDKKVKLELMLMFFIINLLQI